MNAFRNPLISLSFAASLLASASALANHPATKAAFGTPVHDGAVAREARQADRIVTVDADTKEIQIEGGQLVEFVTANGTRTSWLFDVYGNNPTFDLKEIVGADALGGRPVKVYVSPDPRYIGG